MKKMSVLNRLLPTLIVTATALHAEGQAPANPPVVKSEFQTVEATVEAIDPLTRAVSLRGARGPVTVAVGPDVKNLDKVHVGDKVVVSYYQGIVARMAKGDTKATEPAVSTFAYRAQAGKPPGGGAVTSVTATVTIEATDMGTHTVAFRRSDGSVHIIAVESPNMVAFIRTLKPGDSVEVTYTESVAVNIVPAAG
jgi:hypothetical protein